MSKFNSRIQKFAQVSEDTEESRFIKRLILFVSLSCCACGLIWSLIYCIVFGPGLTAMLPLTFVVIVGTTIFISDYLKDHRPLVYAQLFCITWISALIQWSIGSMDHAGLVIAWSFLGPLGAVIFLSFRQSLVWIVMFVIIVVISAAVTPTLSGRVLEVTEAQKTMFYMMNIGVSSIVVFAASAWFVKTIQFERGRANNLLLRIKALFGQHVSTEVANELISQHQEETGSKFYDVTIMFLDIRDFTAYADSRAPVEVAAFQNLIMGEYINLVRAHKGIVLQILGDGILAVFGAPIRTPQHSLDSVNAGFAMIRRTRELGDSGQLPDIRIGIGLHTGKVLAGEIGNEYRKSYSITGSNVIVASRIEQLNKQLQSQFLVSEAVYEKIKSFGYDASFQGRYELKGISQHINIYQLA